MEKKSSIPTQKKLNLLNDLLKKNSGQTKIYKLEDIEDDAHLFLGAAPLAIIIIVICAYKSAFVEFGSAFWCTADLGFGDGGGGLGGGYLISSWHFIC